MTSHDAETSIGAVLREIIKCLKEEIDRQEEQANRQKEEASRQKDEANRLSSEHDLARTNWTRIHQDIVDESLEQIATIESAVNKGQPIPPSVRDYKVSMARWGKRKKFNMREDEDGNICEAGKEGDYEEEPTHIDEEKNLTPASSPCLQLRVRPSMTEHHT